jgi:hypothetical protein
MEDLREDMQGTSIQQAQGSPPSQGSAQPTVLEPVQPQVLNDDLRGLNTVAPYRPGQPVRVMEDLKESGVEK